MSVGTAPNHALGEPRTHSWQQTQPINSLPPCRPCQPLSFMSSLPLLLLFHAMISQKHGMTLEIHGMFLENHGILLQNHGILLQNHGILSQNHGMITLSVPHCWLFGMWQKPSYRRFFYLLLPLSPRLYVFSSPYPLPHYPFRDATSPPRKHADYTI